MGRFKSASDGGTRGVADVAMRAAHRFRLVESALDEVERQLGSGGPSGTGTDGRIARRVTLRLRPVDDDKSPDDRDADADGGDDADANPAYEGDHSSPPRNARTALRVMPRSLAITVLRRVPTTPE